MATPVWDVLVAGAGPAGATAARSLAARGLRVALADRLDRPCRRLEVVSPSLRPLLQGLGIADLLDDPGIARACLGIERRWGGAPVQVEDFLAHRGSGGHVVDRFALDAALRAKAGAAGAALIPLRVMNVAADAEGVVVRFSDGSELPAGRVIDATGRAALPARRLGANWVCSEALTARLVARRVEAQCDGPRWLRVSGDGGGWRYSVEGPGGRQETWSISKAGKGAGGACADASSARLDRAAGTNWAAVGDAAAAFDPVTSQGLANAFSTGAVAAGMILGGMGGGDGSDAAAFYSDAVAATHARSESARREVYAALHAKLLPGRRGP